MENDNQNTGFKDEGVTIWRYLNQIFVHCPKCEKRALVTKDGRGYWGATKLYCPNCHYRKEGRKITYDLTLKFFCPNCAESVEKLIEDVTVKKEEIKVKCPNCNMTQAYKPKYIEKNWVYNPRGEAADPYYRLPLWLRGQIKK